MVPVEVPELDLGGRGLGSGDEPFPFVPVTPFPPSPVRSSPPPSHVAVVFVLAEGPGSSLVLP